MSIGRTKKIVEQSIFADPANYPEDTRDLRFDSRDPIRYAIGKLWTHSFVDRGVIGESIRGLSYSFEPFAVAPYEILYDREVEEVDEGSGQFPVRYRTITLKPNAAAHPPIEGHLSNPIFDDFKWQDLVEKIQAALVDRFGNPKTYQDCPFKYYLPYETSDMEKLMIENHVTLMSDVDTKFNFYDRLYENSLSDAPETIMPCMYAFISEKESDYLDPRHVHRGGRGGFTEDSIYNEHISLDERISGVYTDIINERGERIGERDTGFNDYFNTWGRTYQSTRGEDTYADLNDRFANQIFTQYDSDFLKGLSAKKHMFPMYIDLRFSTPGPVKYSESLKRVELGTNFIHYARNTGPRRLTYNVTQQNVVPEGLRYTAVQSENLETWDVTDWNLNYDPTEWDESEFVMFGRNATNEQGIISGCRPQVANLLNFLLIGRLRQFIRDEKRTIEQIFEEGQYAYSEAVFYGIEKIDLTTEPFEGGKSFSSGIAQQYYIPNSEDLDICNFIDTQVKYEKKYEYRVYSYQLAYGIRYSYERLESEPVILTQAITDGIGSVRQETSAPRFRVKMEPYFKLVKTPYYNTGQVRVTDKPPVAPDVDVIPYKDVDNRVLFHLNGNTGDYVLPPVFIEHTDISHLQEHIEYRQINDSGITTIETPTGMTKTTTTPIGTPVVNYASDDPPEFFVVYRLEQKPTKYQDFSGHIIKIISTRIPRTGEFGLTENYSAASYEDNIEPNKKYYYMFRTQDVHGHPSYPSPVYEVEMVNADGAIYMIMNTIEMKKEDTKVTTKKLNKRIRIAPSFIHSIVDIEKTRENLGDAADSARNITSAGQIGLGMARNGIWNKKFKFRFISKHTGRKFDVNVRFAHKFNKDGTTYLSD